MLDMVDRKAGFLPSCVSLELTLPHNWSCCLYFCVHFSGKVETKTYTMLDVGHGVCQSLLLKVKTLKMSLHFKAPFSPPSAYS